MSNTALPTDGPGKGVVATFTEYSASDPNGDPLGDWGSEFPLREKGAEWKRGVIVYDDGSTETTAPTRLPIIDLLSGHALFQAYLTLDEIHTLLRTHPWMESHLHLKSALLFHEGVGDLPVDREIQGDTQPRISGDGNLDDLIVVVQPDGSAAFEDGVSGDSEFLSGDEVGVANVDPINVDDSHDSFLSVGTRTHGSETGVAPSSPTTPVEPTEGDLRKRAITAEQITIRDCADLEQVEALEARIGELEADVKLATHDRNDLRGKVAQLKREQEKQSQDLTGVLIHLHLEESPGIAKILSERLPHTSYVRRRDG